MARTNSTTFRYSDEVKDILQTVPGDSFADKIEFIVTDYRDAMASRKRDLEVMDNRIERKRQEMLVVLDEISTIKNLISNTVDLHRSILDIKTKCNTYLLSCQLDQLNQVD